MKKMLPAMDCFKDDLGWDFRSKKSFRVIIIGAGIAGLSAAIGMIDPCVISMNLLNDLKGSSEQVMP